MSNNIVILMPDGGAEAISCFLAQSMHIYFHLEKIMTLYITALKQYLLKMFDLELVRDSDNKISLSLLPLCLIKMC